MVARGRMQTRVTHRVETRTGASVLLTEGIRFHTSVCKPNIAYRVRCRSCRDPTRGCPLAAIAAIEGSPALQRGFDNRKSKTASHSEAEFSRANVIHRIRCDWASRSISKRSQVQTQDACNFVDSLGFFEQCFVRVGDDFLGEGGVEMRTPVRHHRITGFLQRSL